jgi:hypothetical protein
MGRLASCGFELNSVTSGIEITASSGSPTIVTSPAHTGIYAFRVSSLSSGTPKGGRIQFKGTAGDGPFYPRIYFRIATAPGAENQFIQLNDTAAFTTPVVYATIDSSRVVRLYDEDGQIGSASSVLSADTWHYIEFTFDRTAAAGSHVVRARLGTEFGTSTEFAGATNRDLSVSVHTLCFGLNLGSEANTQGDIYFDDIVVNESGGNQGGYPGPGGIVHMRPNGTGDNSDWTNDYTTVDEITPNDATDFISSNTLDQIEEVNLEAVPSEIGSSDTINYVGVGFRNNVSDPASTDPVFTGRIKASSGGTVDEFTTLQTASTSAWRTQNDGTTSANYKNFNNNSNYEQPGGSSAWTKSALENTQIGVRVTTGDAHNVQVTALWLLVDYTPAAGGGAISGSANITQAGDTLSSSSKLDIKGTSSKTQANDNLSSASTLLIEGVTTVSQAGDSLSANGKIAIEGTVNLFQEDNTLSSQADLSIKGVSNINQIGDTLASSGQSIIEGSVNVNQESNSLDADAKLDIKANANLTEQGNNLSSQADLYIKANSTITQADNTLDAFGSGEALPPISGSLSITQENNVLAASGDLQIKGTSNLSQSPNASVSSGSVTISSSLNVNQDNNTVISTATSPRHASVNVTQQNNISIASADLFIKAVANLNQANNTLDATGQFQIPIEGPGQLEIIKAEDNNVIYAEEINIIYADNK